MFVYSLLWERKEFTGTGLFSLPRKNGPGEQILAKRSLFVYSFEARKPSDYLPETLVCAVWLTQRGNLSLDCSQSLEISGNCFVNPQEWGGGVPVCFSSSPSKSFVFYPLVGVCFQTRFSVAILSDDVLSWTNKYSAAGYMEWYFKQQTRKRISIIPLVSRVPGFRLMPLNQEYYLSSGESLNGLKNLWGFAITPCWGNFHRLLSPVGQLLMAVTFYL